MGTKSMWTPDMDEQLIRLREAGTSWSVLAATFRCAESCAQLRHIKLTDPAKFEAYKKRKRESSRRSYAEHRGKLRKVKPSLPQKAPAPARWTRVQDFFLAALRANGESAHKISYALGHTIGECRTRARELDLPPVQPRPVTVPAYVMDSCFEDWDL